MWLNGMLKTSNPLAENLINNDIDNADVYRMDPEEPSPFENSDNNVVIPELILSCNTEIIRQQVCEKFDLLAPSTQMGIDIFIMVEEYVYKLLSRW